MFFKITFNFNFNFRMFAIYIRIKKHLYLFKIFYIGITPLMELNKKL